MEELNTVNAVHETVVESQDEANAVSENPMIGNTEQGQEAAKPVQTPEQNEQFKKMRLRAEKDARDKYEKEIKQAIDAEYANIYKGKVNEFTGKPITSKADHDEYERMLGIAQMARERGVSYEEQKEYEDRVRQHILDTDPEIVETRNQLHEMKQKEAQRQFNADLTAIKDKYPDEQAESIIELGENFIKLMATGAITPLRAYEALRAEKEEKIKMPPSTGDIKVNAIEDKDFYTSEEVDMFTSEDYDRDPKLWERVRKSMQKWR